MAVFKNYTTYKTYFKLSKEIEDDPNVNKKQAARAIGRFMSLHPHNLAQKTEVMVEHFRQVVSKKKLTAKPRPWWLPDRAYMRFGIKRSFIATSN